MKGFCSRHMPSILAVQTFGATEFSAGAPAGPEGPGRSGQVREDLKRQTNLGARPTPSSRLTHDSVGFLRRRTANGSRLCSLSRHSSRKGTIFKIASDTARSRQMIRKQSRTPNQSANPPSAPIGVDVKVVSFFPDSSYADNTRRREMTPLFRPV